KCCNKTSPVMLLFNRRLCGTGRLASRRGIYRRGERFPRRVPSPVREWALGPRRYCWPETPARVLNNRMLSSRDTIKRIEVPCRRRASGRALRRRGTGFRGQQPAAVAVASYPDVLSAAFLLHDVFDFSFSEVATAVERSEAACRQLATRARAHVSAARPRG